MTRNQNNFCFLFFQEIQYSSTPVALASFFGVALFLETSAILFVWCRGRQARVAGREALPRVVAVADPLPLVPVPRPRHLRVGVVPAGPRPSAPPPPPSPGCLKANDGDLLFAENLKCKKD